LPRLEVLETRQLPTIGLTATIPGLDFNASGGSEPPDTDVAAGPTYLVETVNTTVAFYNKQTGALVSSQDLAQFFAPAGAGPRADLFDPRITYDDIAGRFVISIVEENDAHKSSFFDFAVSNDSDPTHGFAEVHRLNVEETGSNGPFWADYPEVGWNADAYVYTFNMYAFPGATGAFDHVQVLTVVKSSALDANAGTLSFSRVDRTESADFNLAPAAMHGAAPGAPLQLVEENNGSSNLLFVQMTNLTAATPTFTDTVVNVPSYSPVVPPKQPNGSTITTIIDSGMLSVFTRNNMLVAAQNVGTGGVTQARWYRFDLSGATPTLADWGQINQGPGVFTYFPSIDMAPDGSMGMTFLESSAAEFLSMYVTGRAPTDPAGTMEPPVRVVGGQANYVGDRAGDFSGLSVDPTDGTFWGANEFANQESTNWGTEIAHFIANSTPVLVGGLTFNPSPPVEGNLANLSGTLTDPTANQAHALTVDWGDGTTSQLSLAAGVLTFGPVPHTYAEETAPGPGFPVTVTVNNFTGSSGSGATTAVVQDAHLTAAGVPVTALVGAAFNGPVATFTDANPDGTTADFTAMITWGDGHTSAGTITAAADGSFTVSGSNTYAATGSYGIHVQINDVGGASTSAGVTATVRRPLNLVTAPDAGGGPDVRVLDSGTGAVVTEFLAYDAHFVGGVRVAVATGSTGTQEIITAPGPSGGPDIRVFDATSGALLREFNAYSPFFLGGVYVAAGDVNGDGVPDIITSADAGGGPEVKVFSGTDGSVLMDFLAYGQFFTGGVRVAAGDVNGDGHADIITAPGPGGGPDVRVYSGKDGSLLREFLAFGPFFTGGVYVAAGDVNGDGKADIITGPGASGGPNVLVYSGANGSVLANFLAYGASFTGGVRVAAADVNGDGKAEVITGAGPTGGPQVNVFNGLGTATLDAFYAYDSAFLGGVFVGGM
jgi:hypothetical protein